MTKNRHAVGPALRAGRLPFVAIRVHSWSALRPPIGSKLRFVKKHFETVATLGAPVRLFQIGLSSRSSKKHVRCFAARTPSVVARNEDVMNVTRDRFVRGIFRLWHFRNSGCCERSSPQVKAAGRGTSQHAAERVWPSAPYDRSRNNATAKKTRTRTCPEIIPPVVARRCMQLRARAYTRNFSAKTCATFYRPHSSLRGP
jgi:hypothetical protein